LRALEAGGNAVDACLAMAAMCWVVMPDMCGPGGDLFVLWRKPDGSVQAITGAGAAPAAYDARPDVEDRARLAIIPGAPAAVAALQAGPCRLALRDLFAPAIAAAETGFVVGPRFDRQLQGLPAARFRDELAAASGGRMATDGDTFSIRALAQSLRAWAVAGDVREVLAAAVSEWRARGTTVAETEALAATADATPPLALKLGAWTVYGQAPPSQAIGTLASLGIAGLDTIRHEDGAFRDHVLIESYKAAYAGMQTLGDGADMQAVARQMLVPLRAARESIGPQTSIGPAMNRNYGETTQCAAVDGEGNVVTLIHSLYRPFGARVLSPATGWIANDRGATFSDGVNAPAPGRRPRNTLVNVLLTHADGTAFACGTPGAQAQTQTNLQVLARLIRDPDAAADAVFAPRWSFIGDDRIAIEASLDPIEVEELKAKGHKLVVRPPRDWLMGSVSLAGWRGDLCLTVADDRREALALAL
jgi:gamma-glutamyltranspeptidase/glutathione hydrolase